MFVSDWVFLKALFITFFYYNSAITTNYFMNVWPSIINDAIATSSMWIANQKARAISYLYCFSSLIFFFNCFNSLFTASMFFELIACSNGLFISYYLSIESTFLSECIYLRVGYFTKVLLSYIEASDPWDVFFVWYECYYPIYILHKLLFKINWSYIIYFK